MLSFRKKHSRQQPVKIKAADKTGQQLAENQWAHVMLDFIGDAVLSTDTDTKITYMNVAAETLTGFNRQNAVGQPLANIFRVIDVKTRKTRANLARQVMATDRPVALHNSALLITRSGHELAIEDAATPLHNDQGEIIGALVKFHDSRYSTEVTSRMAYLAQHDALTGLLNRYAFSERFAQAAALAQRHEKKMVTLFIDLDNFKEVNDTMGHCHGDDMLKAMAHKLVGCVRATDHVCRHGGDEFVVLLSDLNQHEQAFAVIDKVLEAAAELSHLNGNETALGLSIGVSIFPDNGKTLDTLLPYADADMYKVKVSHQQCM